MPLTFYTALFSLVLQPVVRGGNGSPGVMPNPVLRRDRGGGGGTVSSFQNAGRCYTNGLDNLYCHVIISKLMKRKSLSCSCYSFFVVLNGDANGIRCRRSRTGLSCEKGNVQSAYHSVTQERSGMG